VPAAAGVELADEGEQARGGGVEVGRERRDLVAQALQLLNVRRRGNQGRENGRGFGRGREDVHRRGLLHRGSDRGANYVSRLYTADLASPERGRARRSAAKGAAFDFAWLFVAPNATVKRKSPVFARRGLAAQRARESCQAQRSAT